MTTEAEQVVSRFVAAWGEASVDELLDSFTDDAVWHPMPMRPTIGKAALREAFTIWLGTTTLRHDLDRATTRGRQSLIVSGSTPMLRSTARSETRLCSATWRTKSPTTLNTSVSAERSSSTSSAPTSAVGDSPRIVASVRSFAAF
jgi:ketosteroid isomerase-like protein